MSLGRRNAELLPGAEKVDRDFVGWMLTTRLVPAGRTAPDLKRHDDLRAVDLTIHSTGTPARQFLAGIYGGRILAHRRDPPVARRHREKASKHGREFPGVGTVRISPRRATGQGATLLGHHDARRVAPLRQAQGAALARPAATKLLEVLRERQMDAESVNPVALN